MVDLVSSSEETTLQIFSQSGLLSQHLKGYEKRESQQEMSLAVMEAYEKDSVLLAEAATGVGKSLAYLVPAILWAAKKNEPTVISTHTIALQEQLIEKDIPFLLEVLGLDMQATLVKGMGNYFCFKKYEETAGESLFLNPQEQMEIEQLEEFSRRSDEGSLSSLPFSLSPGTWAKVSAERSFCTHVECPHFKKCFFFKARRQLAESQILVVNHHLLIADISARLRPDFQEEKSILPKFSRLVLDEAHHLEEIALSSFSVKIDRLDLIRFFGRIYSDLQPQKSRIGLLKSDLISRKKQIPQQVQVLLDVEIPAKKRDVVELLEGFLDEIKAFCEEELEKDSALERRWRFSEEKLEAPRWKEEIKERFLLLKGEWVSLFSFIQLLKKELTWDCSAEEKEFFSIHFSSFEMIESILTERLSHLEQFVLSPFDEKRVRWVEGSAEGSRKNITLVDARLDISKYLRDLLFLSKKTVTLCSATLTSSQNFSFLRKQIGLVGEDFDERVKEKVYESPFDFEKNSLFLVPQDFPLPHEYSFLDRSVALLKKVIQASKGGCFLLFTSYDMLQKCYDKIVLSSNAPPFQYLKQGEAPRQLLVEKFKKRSDSVLFATSSFWEGIDIAGDALRCVVITKLPFRVPTDPLFRSMSEMYEKEGKDPFREYSLPQASLKFKQGFGRLIRTKEDRGCVICLDGRVMKKSYGKVFLRGLPPCPVIYKDEGAMIEEIERFYQGNGA